MQSRFANLDDRIAFESPTALFFHRCQNDAERFVVDFGLDRLEVSVEYISAKFDNVDDNFRAACREHNKEGLFRLTFRDGRRFDALFEKIPFQEVEPVIRPATRLNVCVECGRDPSEFPIVRRSRCSHCWKVYVQSAGLSREDRERLYNEEMNARRRV